MLEKFKKYFPETTSAVGRTDKIGSIGVRGISEELKKPILKFPETVTGFKSSLGLKFPEIDIPKKIKDIMQTDKTAFLKEKLPSATSAIIGKGESLSERIKGRVRKFLGTKPPAKHLVSAGGQVNLSYGREESELGAIPFVKGSANFVKNWNRRQERQYHPGWRNFDFFPELYLMTPDKYKMIGAPPNFPEIGGHYVNEGTFLRPHLVWQSGLKGNNYGKWSQEIHKDLMRMDDDKLVKLKDKRLKYWKEKMETEEKPYWKARARWNYINIKNRALKNYYQLTEKEKSEWESEWNKFKKAGGYPKSLWSALTVGLAY